MSKRRIIIDEKCSICTRELESTIHAIWECAAVQDIWVGSIRTLQNRSLIHTDMLLPMEHLIDSLMSEEVELF